MTAPGDRNFRGSVESAGQFAITDKWVWGWDGVLLTDKTFLQDYNPHLSSYHFTDTFGSAANSGSRSFIFPAKATAAISTFARSITTASRLPTCSSRFRLSTR